MIIKLARVVRLGDSRTASTQATLEPTNVLSKHAKSSSTLRHQTSPGPTRRRMALSRWQCTIMATALMVTAAPAWAQWKVGTAQYDNKLRSNTEALDAQLGDHPDLVHIFNPSKFLIDKDTYEYVDPIGYKMSVIVDPCQDHPFNCCNETYGTGQYIVENDSTQSEDFGEITFLKDDGSALAQEASRMPDDEVEFDEDCEGLSDPFFDCVGLRAKRKRFRTFPVCWDRNESVSALDPCRAPLDGRELEHCVALGYSQTALIIECNNHFKNDPHCGTFLEIHRPEDEEILAATKLRGQIFSGYRMTLISLTYKGRLDRLLCRGEHELWWVQRTRYNFRVEMKKKFYISAPACDWDHINEQNRDYKQLFDVNWEKYEEVPPDDDEHG